MKEERKRRCPDEPLAEGKRALSRERSSSEAVLTSGGSRVRWRA
jgi:hypothetical protein